LTPKAKSPRGRPPSVRSSLPVSIYDTVCYWNVKKLELSSD